MSLLTRSGKHAPILSRLDIAAIIIVSAGICLLLGTLLVLATIAVIQWLPTLWSDSVERSLAIIFVLAVAWLFARGKKIYLV